MRNICCTVVPHRSVITLAKTWIILVSVKVKEEHKQAVQTAKPWASAVYHLSEWDMDMSV